VELKRAEKEHEQKAQQSMTWPPPEWETRIEAERVRAEWRCPITPTAPQRSLESLPLFASGKEEQRCLFE
jgi:hypothetical protein